MVLAKALILMGSNLGDKRVNLDKAFNLIKNDECHLINKSGIYETAPWGTDSFNSYLNQALLIETRLDPFQLLNFLQKIELELGRIRNTKWEDRIIDLDILYYNNFIIDSHILKIPHPELENRRFALIPSCEVSENWEHPLHHKTMRELLNICTDKGKVKSVA